MYFGGTCPKLVSLLVRGPKGLWIGRRLHGHIRTMRIKSGQEVLRDLPVIIVVFILGQFALNVAGALFGFAAPHIMPWPFK